MSDDKNLAPVKPAPKPLQAPQGAGSYKRNEDGSLTEMQAPTKEQTQEQKAAARKKRKAQK